MRIRLAVVSAMALGLSTAAPALAAAPAQHACLGETVSAAAALGRDYGQFVATSAIAEQGVGEAVQAVLAGQFPDEVFPNTCN